MPLPLPILDDRDFKALMAEAQARIPTYTPEWTNFNDSDPGFTLVQLHAWLTETLLWRVNRLPDLAHVHFLNLLGTGLTPARAAQAEIGFRFKDLDRTGDPLTVLVPAGAEIGVDDPALAEPITFTTAATLRGINAAVAAIIVPGTAPALRETAGDYDPDTATLTLLHPFRPFGDAAAPAEMLVGLLLRPKRTAGNDYTLDRFPAGELDLTVFVPQVFEPDATGARIDGPSGHECRLPWQAATDDDDIRWAAFTPAGTTIDLNDAASWTPLAIRGDASAGLTRSGHVWLDLPAGLPMVAFAALSREWWATLGLDKPPTSKAELVADLEDGTLIAADLDLPIWTNALGYVSPPLRDVPALVALIQAGPEPALGLVPEQAWVDLGYAAPPAPHGLVWLRARLTRPRDVAPEIADLRLNTVQATAATTRRSEVLGTSAGRPNERFTLKRTPVLIDPATGEPDAEIALSIGGEIDPGWMRRPDFAGTTRASKVFRLDPVDGTIVFGDGVNGMIPVAGTRIVATRYRVGGGAAGNVAAGTIRAIRTALPQVDTATNLRAAAGGSDAETLAAARLRAPQLLRTRDRAVTAEDFADLALGTPGVALHAAYALPLTRLNRATTPPALIPDSPGAVTVVVLPRNREATPQPDEAQLRLIGAHLNARRLVTTELYVVGPRYVTVERIAAQVIARGDADLKAVQDAGLAALARYFHPLAGGEDGAGWPFGGDIYRGNVFDLLLALPGVARVPELRIRLSGGAADEALDVLPVAAGTLIHLPTAAVTLDVRYARG